MKPAFESKEERFIRIAEARVKKVVTMIDLIGNLSNTQFYAFTFDQVDHIFTTLHESLRDAKKRFHRPSRSHRQTFSLKKPLQLDAPPSSSIPPTICLTLPDGTSLRAVAYDGIDYPCINIYWDTDGYLSGDQVCLVEYNPEKPHHQRICIGAYQSDSDDTKYYAPYIGRKEII